MAKPTRYKSRAPAPLPGDAATAKRLIAELREQGDLEIAGCSLCVRLVLKRGHKPAPCPVCGAMVTREVS